MIITVPSIMTAISVLGVLSILGALALFIHHVLKREHEFQEKEKATFGQYEEIIKRAHEQAADILDKTVTTSEHLLSNVHGTNDTIAADFDKILQAIAQKELQAINHEAALLKKGYENKITQMEATMDQNTATMLQNTAANLDKQMTTFTQNLLTHASKSEEMIGTKTQEMLGQIETEVNEYKRKKLATADQEIYQLIQKTYLEVLGKTLPADVNQELILKALEETKKEGVFNL